MQKEEIEGRIFRTHGSLEKDCLCIRQRNRLVKDVGILGRIEWTKMEEGYE